ncbi:ATP-binding cassette domain-containing protein [Pedobacter petrophilus]|uniref:ATP-binding cassette domain-containing protein n=1 Tax=Pedobacter petrophilus TaxID=1908241 RepID=A0A7K0G561_9SPHI|nr:ABC transporter ATP-binding protein [Pedobacter petrophilus]MRX78136.1 ATP-binding cassette domain-containing protein [Pedobacter petrophilus]
MGNNNWVSHISIENVSFGYHNQKVIENLNLKVNKGEIVVIIGPSGCGKTSLLNLLNGYLLPQSGAVQMNGLIRTVHQHGSLFPWLTVNENIGIGLRHLKSQRTQQKAIQDMLELINMEGFEDHYPHQLSGGMKQRVELGRVLAGDADIILMDEPFSSLDYQARLKMRRELIGLLAKRPKTVIMVTHDIEEAVQIADRILVLTKRPSMVCAELDVNVAHPRHISDPDLIKIADNVLHELGL